MEVIKNNENADQVWDLADNHKKSRVLIMLFFSFFNASSGYPIGKNWKFLKHCLSSANFYIDFLWSFIFLFVLVSAIMQVTAYLDEKQLWRDGLGKRLSAQLLFAFVSTFLLAEAMDSFYLQVTSRSLFRISQTIIQVPFSLTLTLIYTLFYSITSLYTEYVKHINYEEVALEDDNKLSNGEDIIEKKNNDSKNTLENNPVITIREGKEIRMKDLDIVWISNGNGVNTIYERNHAHPPIQDGHPLKYWTERLDPKDYYQVSRWDLVHRDIIKGYHVKPDKNFKLELDYPGEYQLGMNKDKIDDFSKWFLGEV